MSQVEIVCFPESASVISVHVFCRFFKVIFLQTCWEFFEATLFLFSKTFRVVSNSSVRVSFKETDCHVTTDSSSFEQNQGRWRWTWFHHLRGFCVRTPLSGTCKGFWQRVSSMDPPACYELHANAVARHWKRLNWWRVLLVQSTMKIYNSEDWTTLDIAASNICLILRTQPYCKDLTSFPLLQAKFSAPSAWTCSISYGFQEISVLIIRWGDNATHIINTFQS